MAKGLLGRFLLLETGWCESCRIYEGGQRLQFVPTMTIENPANKYMAGSEITMPDGKKARVLREVIDWDGLLSSLMSLVVESDKGKIPAMQSLAVIMREAYDHGRSDETKRSDEEFRRLQEQNSQTMNAKVKELANLRGELQAANEREMAAAKTVAELTNQLRVAKRSIGALKKQLRETKKRAQEQYDAKNLAHFWKKEHEKICREYAEYRQQVADSAKTEPTSTPTEPQPEAVTAPTNGESNGSNNTNGQ